MKKNTGRQIASRINPKIEQNSLADMINNPPHYKANGVEVIDIIDAFDLDFYTGTVVAYLLRAGRKANCPRVEDLKKAAWYLDRLIVGIDNSEDSI